MNNFIRELQNGIFVSSAEELQELGERIVTVLPEEALLLVNGQLGSGKTTLAQGVAKGLGIHEPVISPSFSLLNFYSGPTNFYHIDAYRVPDRLDLDELYLDELIREPFCIFIEWFQKVLELPQGNRVLVDIDIVNEMRKVTVRF